MKSTILVLDAAYTYNLVTLGDVLLELQITNPTYADEALIEKQIAGVSAAISKYCDRVFALERVEETIWDEREVSGLRHYGNNYNWWHGGYRQHTHPSLYLKRYPITSIDSVYVDDVALTSDSNDSMLRIDRDNGILFKLNEGYPVRWHFGKSIVATYTGGYATIPEDLQRIAIRWVEMAWFAAGQDATVKSEQVYGIASVTYGSTAGTTATSTVGVPDEIKVLLEPYIRQWSFA